MELLSTDGLLIEENNGALTIDVREHQCPEYLVKFILSVKAYKKPHHNKVILKTCAPSIADEVTKQRIAIQLGLNVISDNIDFERNAKDVVIPIDKPVVVEFSTN